eukprot:g8964.t1
METKKVQKEEAEEREKAAKKEDEANEREEIEEKAKEMLKSLPPLPEDDQANHRSWESQLSSKDVKHQMEASREMDKLRDKQHAGAFFVQGRRPASGFLHFADPQAPPGHFSSESARASATEEEDHANHRRWLLRLTAEDLKSQMTASRERDSLRGKPLAEAGGNEGADEGAGGASGGASSEGSGGIRGKRGEGRGAAKRSADLTGDEDEGGAEAASRVVLLPVVRQIGESVGLHSSLQNHITTFDLALKHSRAPKFFFHKKITDRSIDEVVDFQVQLFDRNDPIISARSARGSMAPASYRYGNAKTLGAAAAEELWKKAREEEAEPRPLQIQYSIESAGEEPLDQEDETDNVTETVFEDPNEAKLRPRLLVPLQSVLGLKALCEREYTRTETVTELLNQCRTAYYKELLYLREQLILAAEPEKQLMLDAVQNYEVYFFNPPAYVDDDLREYILNCSRISSEAN